MHTNGASSTRRNAIPAGIAATQSPVFLDEDGEDTPALRWVDDDRGRRRQVGGDAVLEVEGELRWRRRRWPAPGARPPSSGVVARLAVVMVLLEILEQT